MNILILISFAIGVIIGWLITLSYLLYKLEETSNEHSN